MAQKDFQLDSDVQVGTRRMWEDTWCRIIFPKPFKHVPKVFLTVNDDVPRSCYLQAERIALKDFYIRVIKTAGGQAAEHTVAWLAMDYE